MPTPLPTSSPISARLPMELRQDLARYCVAHELSQTDAIAAGLRLLLGSEPDTALTAVQAAAGLGRLEQELATRLRGFDAEAAEDEGRD